MNYKSVLNFCIIHIKLFLGISIIFSCTIKCFSQNNSLDFRILQDISNTRTSNKNNFMKGISNSEQYVIPAITVGMIANSFIKKDSVWKQKSLALVESQLATIALGYSIKYIINRQRPYVKVPSFIPVVLDNGPSFPSNHTAIAFATATSITLSFPKWYVAVPLYAYAGYVGYSRMYLGVHYPSDVLIGAILGSGTAYLSYKANKWLNKRHKNIIR